MVSERDIKPTCTLKWPTLRSEVAPLQPLVHDKVHDRTVLLCKFGAVLAVSSQIAWHPHETVELIAVDDLLDFFPRVPLEVLVQGAEDFAVFVILERVLQIGRAFFRMTLERQIDIPEWYAS